MQSEQVKLNNCDEMPQYADLFPPNIREILKEMSSSAEGILASIPDNNDDKSNGSGLDAEHDDDVSVNVQLSCYSFYRSLIIDYARTLLDVLMLILCLFGDTSHDVLGNTPLIDLASHPFNYLTIMFNQEQNESYQTCMKIKSLCK